MIAETKNNKQIILSRINTNNFNALSEYLQQLSAETRKRFGPHPFDQHSISEFYNFSDKYFGYIAHTIEANKIIAYSVIKIGYLEHDRDRLESYGITLNQKTDCTFAPSVADAWQSMGIGNKLLQFIIADLQPKGINRIILWGGVQTDNEKAVNYYLKNGFKIAGNFSHNGENYDMTCEIH